LTGPHPVTRRPSRPSPRTGTAAPELTVVVLTLNEEANIRGCLRSLARQEDRRFEVILVDAASSDDTVAIARRMASAFPVPLRIEAAKERLPIGAARNLGVRLARAPNVAFLSADAEAEPGWVAQALAGLSQADMVFGRQVHAPHGWTLGASVRGLRYAFPTGPVDDALAWASNVSAAYRRHVLHDHPFDDHANAAEDLLIARRAANAGATATYDPHFRVRHHDVADWRTEWRKNVREGQGWAEYRRELGGQPRLLAWGAAIAACAGWAIVRPGLVPLGFLAAVVWAPAVRRALRRRSDAPPLRSKAVAVLASPLFDLAFLASYLRGLARPAAPDRRPVPETTHDDPHARAPA
jgi:hypothetical protein